MAITDNSADSQSDELRPEYDLAKPLMPLFAKCVLPIYGEHQGAAIQCGTGTLFRVADVAFLVTASHVTDLAAKKHVQLYISDAVAGSPGLALEGRLHSERNMDVSLWELPAQMVN